MEGQGKEKEGTPRSSRSHDMAIEMEGGMLCLRCATGVKGKSRYKTSSGPE